VTFLLLLFPDGHPPSPRWRAVGWLAGTGIALAVAGTMIGLWPVRHAALENPDTVQPVGVGTAVLPVGFLLTAVAAIGAIASLVVRFRRSTGDERQQLRWFTVAALVVVVGTFLSFTNLDASYIVLSIGFFLVPIAVAIAILKYRLYELDVVINKTLVYGVLAAFVTMVYVGLVIGVGAAIGSAGNAVLSAVAAAVVALAFQPVRRWAQRLANRLVYGERATPYEVLSEFSARMGGAFATEDLLPRMARILGEGTGAERADVWLRVGQELHVEASWPDEGSPAATSVGLDEIGSDLVPVSYRGELLGALSVAKRLGDTLTHTESKLIDDLASQAGLVLRNVALTEELRARLEELRESRRRIVAAQDDRAKKLERDIHDGAQQQLVALTVKLRLAGSFVGADDDRARAMLAELSSETNEALENLRDLARGIYPPLLADQGLAAALEAQTRKSAVPVSIDTDGIGRYSQEVESAVYFSVLEALQNVAKYAAAQHVNVRLSHGAAGLRFEVEDDGVGFDPVATAHGTGLQGITDRLDAVGGEIQIASTPGEGARISGRVPSGIVVGHVHEEASA
jgi:signal transduction histidine kinase